MILSIGTGLSSGYLKSDYGLILDCEGKSYYTIDAGFRSLGIIVYHNVNSSLQKGRGIFLHRGGLC